MCLNFYIFKIGVVFCCGVDSLIEYGCIKVNGVIVVLGM